MSEPLEARRLTDQHRPEWHRFVAAHPDATVFHSLGWLDAVEETFGYGSRHRLLYDSDGSCVAVVPGFRVSGVTGLGSSVLNPFCEYGFPLVEGVDEVRVLSTLGRVDVDRLGARIVKGVEWGGPSSYNEAGYGAVRTGTVRRLAVDRSFSWVWEETFGQNARRNVRRAEEAGVTVREGTTKEFYGLYLTTMRRRGSPPFPASFFECLDAELEEGVTVLVAELDGDPIGSQLVLEFGEETITWGNGSDHERWEARPNYLLDARTVERACESDRTVVDLGRSRPGTGVHEFKSQFGGEEYRLVSYVSPPHRTGRASLEGYGRLEPLTRRFGNVIAHPSIGPRLKEAIHE